MSAERPLTTAEIENWKANLERHRCPMGEPLEGEVTIEFDRILATTREIERAVAELSSSSFARDRYANTIGLIESAIGFSGASPVDETIERVRRLKAERDDGAARAEKAERERDAAMARVAELETALEGLFVEYDNLRNAGSKHALTYWVDRLPDHACAECVPGGPIVAPGFRCREHSARAALAKAKGATNG